MRKFLVCGALCAAVLLSACGGGNKIAVPYSSDDCAGKDAAVVQSDFQAAGFTDVTLVAKDTASPNDVDGSFCSIEIGTGALLCTGFKSTNAFPADDKIVITYYNSTVPDPTPTPAPTASPAQQLAQQVNVSDEYAQSLIDAFSQIGVTDLSGAKNVSGFVVVPYDGYDLYSDAIPSGTDTAADTAADTVQNIYYGDTSFFTDGQPVATVNDVFVTAEQATWLIVCVDDDVKQYLKSPSTAKFPGKVLEKDAYTVAKDAQYYYVKAYVDSQNSFGATIRTNFIVTYQWDGDTSILPTCVDVTFDE